MVDYFTIVYTDRWMRILVTGGAGYIGSVVAWRLAQQGHLPIVFDNLSTGYAEAVRFGPFVQGDLCVAEEIEAAVRQHRPEAVMHFAAKSVVGESVAHPGRYFYENMTGALHLLEAIRKGPRCPVIFSSTAAVYGLPQHIPLSEEHPLCPVSPYGDTKVAIERMLFAYDQAYGVPHVCLRYFNAAGAVVEAGMGERHCPETHLIPLVLQVALGQRSSIAIYGRSYETPDGTCIRDYIHVVDLADAHLAALAYLLEGQPSACVNLGTEKGHSVLEVLEVCREVTGHAIPSEDAPARSGDPPVLIASGAKARKLLQWQHVYELREMVSSAWEVMLRSSLGLPERE